MKVIIKMCGNRSAADLVNAAEAGADLVGIIFADAWRRVPVEQARDMAGELRERVPSPPPVVGVFVDQPEDEVNRTADVVGLDMVQLHGTEDADYWRRIERPLIVARRIPAQLTLEEASARIAPVLAYTGPRDFICLIEPYVDGLPGGAGVSMQRDLAAGLARRFPFILAGGLTPENVGEAVRAVRPWGVDVSSGVETDRVKDPAKVGRFIHEARRASLAVAP
jgi:phosphoribosylanthranilate isomerase